MFTHSFSFELCPPNPFFCSLRSGQTYELKWAITACHCNATTAVTWYIAYNGEPANLTKFGPSTLTGTANGDRSAMVTLPNVTTSEHALLMWVWTGTEPLPNTYYIGCTDIRVLANPDDIIPETTPIEGINPDESPVGQVGPTAPSSSSTPTFMSKFVAAFVIVIALIMAIH